MLAKSLFYRSITGVDKQLPDWCLYAYQIGEAAASIKGVFIVLICPDEQFSALFSAVGALSASEVNHSSYLNANPCVYIANSHNPDCDQGKRYLFDSRVFESGEYRYKFIGAESSTRFIRDTDFHHIVIPQKNENSSDWIEKKTRSCQIPQYGERDASWKTISLVGNKSELLKAAQQKWFYGLNGALSISSIYSIDGLVENSKAHKSIHIDPSSTKKEQSEYFEIWSGKIPYVENNHERSFVSCIGRTTSDLEEQVGTFINRCRALGQSGLRPLTLDCKPIDHPLYSLLNEAPSSLGICAFAYVGGK